MQDFQYVPLILLFPIIGVILNGLFGKKYFPKKLIHTIACSTVFLSFLLSFITFIKFIAGGYEHKVVEIYQFLNVGELKVSFSVLIDPLSLVMMLVVTFVGFLIHVYSIGYMSNDPGYYRYFTYLNLFIFAMLTLIMGANFLMLFIGWEGVGLCSYLLIGFWFEKDSAANAGKKAFIVNRVGDFGFLIGMFLIFATFKSLDFQTVFNAAPKLASEYRLAFTAITLLLLVGATGKSAQIPLYVWLPDAMEGPTPVSALIHAATMVTAGVYMIARTHILYVLANPISLFVVGLIGALTAFYAATIGLVQNDIKRVLAYSTISQIGYMVLACGVGAFASGIFHLMTHAFFKALLFLGSGSVIHAMEHAFHSKGIHKNPQDMRYMGGLKKHLPITYWTFLIATLAIAGIPPFAGFFSKDEILEHALLGHYSNFFFWLLGLSGALLTSFYMFRLVYLTFHGEFRSGKDVENHLHESPKVMTIPLSILAFFSAVIGFVGIPKVIPELFGIAKEKVAKLDLFESFLEPVFRDMKMELNSAVGEHGVENVNKVVTHAGEGNHLLPIFLMILSVIVALIGWAIAKYLYVNRRDLPEKIANKFKLAYKVLYNKYYVDEIYNYVFVDGTKNLGILLGRFDLKIIDGFVNLVAYATLVISKLSGMFDLNFIDGLVNAVGWFVKMIGRLFRKLQTGYVHQYAIIFLIGIILVLGIMFLI